MHHVCVRNTPTNSMKCINFFSNISPRIRIPKEAQKIEMWNSHATHQKVTKNIVLQESLHTYKFKQRTIKAANFNTNEEVPRSEAPKFITSNQNFGR